jgi:hypothetical protein
VEIGSPKLRQRIRPFALPLLVVAALIAAPVAQAGGGVDLPASPESTASAGTATDPGAVATPATGTVDAAAAASSAPPDPNASAPVDAAAATAASAVSTVPSSPAAGHPSAAVQAILPSPSRVTAPVTAELRAAGASLLPHVSPRPLPSVAAPAVSKTLSHPTPAHTVTAPRLPLPSRSRALPPRKDRRPVGSVALARPETAPWLRSVPSAPRATAHLSSGGGLLPAPPAPQRPADLGAGGAAAGASSGFVLLLLIAAAALAWARPRVGRLVVAPLLDAPRPALLVLDLERPD